MWDFKNKKLFANSEWEKIIVREGMLSYEIWR